MEEMLDRTPWEQKRTHNKAPGCGISFPTCKDNRIRPFPSQRKPSEGIWLSGMWLILKRGKKQRKREKEKERERKGEKEKDREKRETKKRTERRKAGRGGGREGGRETAFFPTSKCVHTFRKTICKKKIAKKQSSDPVRRRCGVTFGFSVCKCKWSSVKTNKQKKTVA